VSSVHAKFLERFVGDSVRQTRPRVERFEHPIYKGTALPPRSRTSLGNLDEKVMTGVHKHFLKFYKNKQNTWQR